MISGVQILGIIFGLGLLYLAFLSFKRQEFTPVEWSFWTVLSIAVIAMSIFPQALNPIILKLSFKRALDLYVILGFMFLISATFYTYTVARKTQRRLEEFVRKTAINHTLKTIKKKK